MVGKRQRFGLTEWLAVIGVVLAAPPASGFNLAAWVMPFAALAIGALLAIYFLRQFRSRWVAAEQPTEGLSKYQDKVEEELKKFTPED